MKVLIIDDEEDTRRIASMSLSIFGGVEVVESDGAESGLVKAEQEQPDVILLDILMPGVDGVEQPFLQLRRNPATEKIPVIFLTVKGVFSEFDRLKNMGALAVLTKPFNPEKLSAQIMEILDDSSNKTLAPQD